MQLYFDKYIGAGQPGLEPAADIDEAVLREVAARLEGFSGRAISKLMISAQGAAYGSAEAVLSRAALEEVVATKMAQRTRQQEMREEQGVGGQDEWS